MTDRIARARVYATGNLLFRARDYVRVMPAAISLQHGHTATFKVAVALVHGFGLSEDEALPILEEYSARCQPPWSRKDLEYKLKSATHNARTGKPRGYLRDTQRAASPEPPPPQRPKKKISLCLDTGSNASAKAQAEQKAAESIAKTHTLADPDASGQATAQGNPRPPLHQNENDQDERRAAWIAAQLTVFADEGIIPRPEDGSPDTHATAELAHWLELAREAYEARGIKAPDEEIRRTALACQFEHRNGMLPTPEAARGFLSVRLTAMHDPTSQAEQDGADPGFREDGAWGARLQFQAAIPSRSPKPNGSISLQDSAVAPLASSSSVTSKTHSEKNSSRHGGILQSM